MTRTDYIKIASAIRRVHAASVENNTVDEMTVHLVAFMLAEQLQADNPHFDRARFMHAAVGTSLPIHVSDFNLDL